jgi:hypothetical protein
MRRAARVSRCASSAENKELANERDDLAAQLAEAASSAERAATMADAECKRQVEAMALRMREEVERRGRGERSHVDAQVARLLAELSAMSKDHAELEGEHVAHMAAQRAEYEAVREAAALLRIDELSVEEERVDEGIQVAEERVDEGVQVSRRSSREGRASELEIALAELGQLHEEVVQAKAALSEAMAALGMKLDENKTLQEQLQVRRARPHAARRSVSPEMVWRCDHAFVMSRGA